MSDVSVIGLLHAFTEFVGWKLTLQERHFLSSLEMGKEHLVTGRKAFDHALVVVPLAYAFFIGACVRLYLLIKKPHLFPDLQGGARGQSIGSTLVIGVYFSHTVAYLYTFNDAFGMWYAHNYPIAYHVHRIIATFTSYTFTSLDWF